MPVDSYLSETLIRLDQLDALKAPELARAQRPVPLAVLDTNVVLDLWYWNDRKCSQLKKALSAGALRAVSSSSCLKELAAVLARPVFELSVSEKKSLLETVLSSVWVAKPTVEALVRCKDAEDEKFLNLAFEIEADYLFTKDKRVLRAGRKLRALGTQTLTPADFRYLPKAD